MQWGLGLDASELNLPSAKRPRAPPATVVRHPPGRGSPRTHRVAPVPTDSPIRRPVGAVRFAPPCPYHASRAAGKSNALGKVEIHWKSNLGESGHLQTTPIEQVRVAEKQVCWPPLG